MKKGKLIKGEGQGFGSGHAKLKIFIRHLSGEVKETDTIPEFRGKVRDEGKAVKVINCGWYF